MKDNIMVKDFVRDGVILNTKDGGGPCGTWLSIEDCTNVDDGVHIVVGAEYCDRSAMRFTKKGLKKLITILLHVHNAMEK